MGRMPSMHAGRQGYVMQDFLLTLLIVVVMAQILTSAVALAIRSMQYGQDVQDEIALAQLRRILIISDDFRTDGSVLYFVNQGRQMTLRLVNENLIIQPGTQIMLVDVDSVSFLEEGNLIRCIYERKGIFHERIIALQ